MSASPQSRLNFTVPASGHVMMMPLLEEEKVLYNKDIISFKLESSKKSLSSTSLKMKTYQNK
jgi:hypothetical protein